MAYFRIRRRLKWLDILDLRNSSNKAAKWRTQGLVTTFVVGLAVALYLSDSASAPHGPNLSNFHGASRRLLETANDTVATSHGPAWEQCDFEKDNSRYAWLFNHVFFILVIFIAIAIVCDDFFVPSLEIISEKLKLSEDVAGATFMAAGSSAPELFSSVAGVAVESDVGVGTIVGSAVFNLLIIIALTAALAGQILTLDWRPLMRDAFFYAMSIGCFIGFAWDGEFTHYESAILLVLYALYITLMAFNPRLMDWMATWRCCCVKKVEPVEDGKDKAQETQLNGSTTKLDERKLSMSGGHARRLTLMHMAHRNSSSNELEHPGRQFVHHQRGSIAGVLMMKHPRPHRRDSGFQSRENSSYVPSNDTSRTDLSPGVDPSYAKESSLRPPTLSAHQPATAANGNVGESYEMQPTGTTKTSTNPTRGASNDIQEMTDSTSSDDQLLPAITIPRPVYNDQPGTKLPPISSDSGSSIGPPKLPAIQQEKSLPETGKTITEEAENGHHAIPSRKSIQQLEDTVAEEPSVSALKEEEEDEDEEQTINICPCLPCCPAVRTWPPSAETAKEEGGCWNWFKYIFKWVLFIPAFPFVCLYSWTIPNCAKEELKKYYILSFVMSVFWIALLSFGMVTLVGRAGCILGVDSYIMGLIVVAIGTSIPDALSSVLVARDGFGDMAVSNAIGSNVFDINLGLGLPFIIRIAIDRGKPISLLDDQEAVDLATGHMPLIQHAKFGFILLLILFIALLVFFAARFRLNKWIGVCFVIMYIMFICYALIQELYCIRQLGDYC